MLYSVWSIGQIFKGMYYHKPALKHIWPLVTKESEPYRECIETFVMRFMQGVSVCKDDICHLDKQENELAMIEATKSKLAHIYSNDNLNTVGMKPEDVIVDITGGTRAISLGLTFGALDSSIDIQYVEQEGHNVIHLAITPEIVLDKMGRFLEELYVRLQIEKAQLNQCRQEES